MTKPIYTAEAHVTGGRQNGRGRTTDGALDIALRLPQDGGGTNPEQLFAIGYAACFEASIGLAAQRSRVPVELVDDVAITSKVMLLAAGKGALRLGVELAVELPSVEDPQQAAELVRAAHGICPYSNAVRGNVEVAISVNGEAFSTD